ncbi:MAG: hypothetical protein ACRDVE_18030 [Actinocrinis sp.]
MVLGGVLVLAGSAAAIGAAWVGYRLAVSHEHQLQHERRVYGAAEPPGR